MYTKSTGIILCMYSANERQRYIVMLSLFGWMHTQIIPESIYGAHSNMSIRAAKK